MVACPDNFYAHFGRCLNYLQPKQRYITIYLCVILTEQIILSDNKIISFSHRSPKNSTPPASNRVVLESSC